MKQENQNMMIIEELTRCAKYSVVDRGCLAEGDTATLQLRYETSGFIARLEAAEHEVDAVTSEPKEVSGHR